MDSVDGGDLNLLPYRRRRSDGGGFASGSGTGRVGIGVAGGPGPSTGRVGIGFADGPSACCIGIDFAGGSGTGCVGMGSAGGCPVFAAGISVAGGTPSPKYSTKPRRALVWLTYIGDLVVEEACCPAGPVAGVLPGSGLGGAGGGPAGVLRSSCVGVGNGVAGGGPAGVLRSVCVGVGNGVEGGRSCRARAGVPLPRRRLAQAALFTLWGRG